MGSEIYQVRVTLIQMFMMVIVKVIDSSMKVYKGVLRIVVVSYKVIIAVRTSCEWLSKPFSCHHRSGEESHLTYFIP